MLVLLTVAIGIAGGLIGLWLSIPAGPMIGAMVAVATVRVLRPSLPPMSRTWRHGARILLGSVIGAGFTPAVLNQGLGLALPAAVLAVVVFVSGIVGGVLLSRMAGLDLSTSLFACVPGGMSEMSTIADDCGGDAGMVAAIQFLRVLVVVIFVPPLLFWLLSNGVH